MSSLSINVVPATTPKDSSTNGETKGPKEFRPVQRIHGPINKIGNLEDKGTFSITLKSTFLKFLLHFFIAS